MIRTLPLDLSWLFIFSYTAWAIGNKILSLLKIEFPNRSFQFLYSIGTGLTFFSTLTFILGFSGLLYRSIFITLLLILFTLTLIPSPKGRGKPINFPTTSPLSLWKTPNLSPLSLWERARVRGDITFFEILLLLFLATSIFSNLIFNYSPPTQPRETMYDLSLPKTYLTHHKIIDLPDKHVHYYPLQIQMLYLMGMALNGVLLAKLIHFLFGILSLCFVYSLARNYFGEKPALYSAVIFYLMPVITSLSGTANIDLGTLFYGLLTFGSLLLWWDSGKNSFLYYGAFCAGVTLGTKLIGLSVPIAYLILTCFLSLRKTPNSSPPSLWERRKHHTCGVFGVRVAYRQYIYVCFFILLGISPWIFRNLIFTGNPVAPISIPFLGIQGHPDSDLEVHMGNQIKASLVGKDFLNGCHNIFFGNFIYGGGPLLFTLLIPAFLQEEHKKRTTLIVTIAALNYVLLFFLLPYPHKFYETRYFIVSYGIFAILSGVGLNFILSKFNHSAPFKGLILASLFFPCLLFSLLFSYKRLPLFLGFESQTSYLQSKLKFFNIFTFANQKLLPNSKVLTLGNSNPDELYWNATLVMPSRTLLQEEDTSKVLKELKNEGIHTIFFYDPAYKPNPNSSGLISKQSLVELLRWPWEEFKSNYLNEIYKGADGTLYRITYP